MIPSPPLFASVRGHLSGFVCMSVCKCFPPVCPALMQTGLPLILTEQYGIPYFFSCGHDDASKKAEQPEGLAAAWPSADHCCGWRGRPCWKLNLPWMVGAQLNKILILTTSVKQIWYGVEKAQRNTFIDIYSSLVSTDLLFLICHPWVEIYRSDERDLYLFSSNYSFLSHSLSPSFLWHFSISAPINFSLLKDSTASSLLFPVSQTPAQTNIVFNALLLVMNPSVDLARTLCWLAI